MSIESSLNNISTSETTNLPEVLITNEIPVAQGSLVFMVGPPGAGKSTFSEKHFPNETIVPTDGLRLGLSNNPGNQLVSNEAFNLAARIVSSRLKNGETVVLDAMNLDPALRQRFAKFAKENNSPVIAICLDIPEEELLRRNSVRVKKVGDEYLRIRIQRAKKEIDLLERDTNINKVYRLKPELIDQAVVELSDSDKELLEQDIKFAQDVKIAETNLLEYATAKIEHEFTLESEIPRLTVEVGSANFFPKNDKTIEFLKRNVLPSQVIDLDWAVKRMGTTFNDPAVYHYVNILLKNRENLNVTTFIIFDETTSDLATRLFKEGKFSRLHDKLDEELLTEGILEVNRPGDEDTPLLILGDIHGCMTALRAHERNVFRENRRLNGNQPKRRMLFVGDIADRGPFDAETVIFTSALVRNREAVWVKGNHDINLEKGLSIIVAQAQSALESGSNWEEWLSNLDVQKELKDKILSGATIETIRKLLFTDKDGQRKVRLKLNSINKILEVLRNATTYKEYKHLVAVHGSLPRIPRLGEELDLETQKIHTHGKKLAGPNWTGRTEVMEMPTVVAKDPDVFTVSGHTHKGPYINEISGTANLDYDGGSKGSIAAMYWMGTRHGEIVYEQEPSMLKLFEQLNQTDLPKGRELIEFLNYIKGQGMIETKQGPEGSVYEGLTIINYSQITELQSLWDTYPILRNFRGLIIDAEGKIVARPFKKTHKVGIEVPLEELDIIPDKIFEKANGSMGVCYLHKGEWHIATKFSFDNKGYTQPAKRLLNELNKKDLNPNNTYLFEIILKNDSHIVNYGDTDKLILLNATNTQTGQEIEWEEIVSTSKSLGVELVPEMTGQFQGMTIAEIYKYAQTPGNLVNMEGLMVQYPDPQTGEKITVKVKAIDYDKKKFIRDRLKWDKIIENFDWTVLDISSEKKESMLAYNLDDPFVRSALETRISWIRKEFYLAIEEIQEFLRESLVEAQEVYDNVISSGGTSAQSVSKAMSVANISVSQKFESEENINISKSAKGQILGFLRRTLASDPRAYEALESFAKEKIIQKIEKETQKRGNAAYWLTPED